MKKQTRNTSYTLALLVVGRLQQASNAFVVPTLRHHPYSPVSTIVGRSSTVSTYSTDIIDVTSTSSSPLSPPQIYYSNRQIQNERPFQTFVTTSQPQYVMAVPSTQGRPSTTLAVAEAITGTTVNLMTKISNSIGSVVRFDKKKFAKVGVSFALTYSMISNVNGSISLSIAWYLASARTGLSPLARGNWKSLVAAYGGLYLFIFLMRPLRVGLAMALTKKMDAFLDSVQTHLNCSRPTAIGVQASLSALLWAGCIAGGVSAASAMSGIPIFA